MAQQRALNLQQKAPILSPMRTADSRSRVAAPERATALAAVLEQRLGCVVPILPPGVARWSGPSPAAITVLPTEDLEQAALQLTRDGAHVDLIGRVGPGDARALAVLSVEETFAEPVPDAFRVLAIVPAYNEADVVVGTVQDLLDQGVDVHLLDNWSTDGTGELVGGLSGRGRVTVERFPAADAPVRYEWEKILRRVEQVAAASGADWCVLHDADERRTSPWPGRDLRSALHEVSRRGFNAVDHTVWEYHPIDNGFRDGDDVARALRHWAPPQVGANRTQVKAWSAPGRQVDLATAGGHEAAFPSRRVFPFHFLLQHYPIRSQHHGEQKVLVDRKPRFSAEERQRLWHRHYDHVRAGHDFLRAPRELLLDSAAVRDELLLERVTGSETAVAPPGPIGVVARSVLGRSGLRPVFVAVRRGIRIARRRNPETGRR